MKTLNEINKEYGNIIHYSLKEPTRSHRLAALMTEMEREFKVPAIRNEGWESQNKAVITLYRQISLSRDL